MVQVDAFWAYGIGAGFAVANARQLRSEAQPLTTASFREALLFLAVLFAPSGICLLWAFPSWETMHVGDRNMPAWLVTAFAATNVTQGILGFWAASRFIARGKAYGAYLQWLAAYFCMFFVLVHGWDGSGYRRFFSPTREALGTWTWHTAATWVTSDVAITLGILGVFIVPGIVVGMSRRLTPHAIGATSMKILALTVLGLPATAVVASLMVRALGWPIGLVGFALIAWAVGVRRGGLFHLAYRGIFGGDAHADDTSANPASRAPIVTSASAGASTSASASV